MIGIDLLSFPKPVLFEIGKKIEEIKDLINFCSTCKKLRSLIDLYWSNLLQKHYPKSYDQKMNEEECKRRYKAIHRIKPKILLFLIQNLKEKTELLKCDQFLNVVCTRELLGDTMIKIQKMNEKDGAKYLSEQDNKVINSFFMEINKNNNFFSLDFDTNEFNKSEDPKKYLKNLLEKTEEDKLYLLTQFIQLLHFSASLSENKERRIQHFAQDFHYFFINHNCPFSLSLVQATIEIVTLIIDERENIIPKI